MQKVQLPYKLLVGRAAAFADEDDRWDHARECAMADVFDLWERDQPSLRGIAVAEGTRREGQRRRRVRTGGVAGTTWHNWGGPAQSIETSNAMRAQTTHRMAADDTDGALGHERHIDHIYVCRTAADRGAVRVVSARVVAVRA